MGIAGSLYSTQAGYIQGKRPSPGAITLAPKKSFVNLLFRKKFLMPVSETLQLSDSLSIKYARHQGFSVSDLLALMAQCPGGRKENE